MAWGPVHSAARRARGVAPKLWAAPAVLAVAVARAVRRRTGIRRDNARGFMPRPFCIVMRSPSMSDATAANQKQILANQKQVLANQKQILGNQKRIESNQAKLDRLLKNQKKLDQILANQKTILAKLG
jgi:hypothetical protein